jgi:hypothetical protein
MRIAIFSKYDRTAASTRQRFLQYSKYLSSHGIQTSLFPLLDEEYLTEKYEVGRVGFGKISKAYFNRLFRLLDGKKFDLLWVHCETFPMLPAFFEKLPSLVGRPIVYDLDDAIFNVYDTFKHRWFFRDKLRPLVNSSSLVICGNQYIQRWAQNFGAKTAVVPTVVDTNVYTSKIKKDCQKLIVGWIGSPTTSCYLDVIWESLLKCVSGNLAEILIIGSGKLEQLDSFVFKKWIESEEVADIQSMDVGIMPLTDTPWSRGKCGYKLIQYMGCGVPVIASPVGVNSTIVNHGVNGFLAETANDWDQYLHMLLTDKGLRDKMGRAGRRTVEDWYSLDKQAPRIAQLLSDAYSKTHD